MNGVGLGFDVVVNGWCGIVGRGVLGIVHSGVNVEMDGMVTVVCWRSVFKMWVVGDLSDWCMSWWCFLSCVIVTCCGSGASDIYSRVCCASCHGG